MATQKPIVFINGELENIPSGDFIGIAQGGTGAVDAPGARTALGLAIGTNVQAFSSELSAVAGLALTGIPVRTGAATYAVRTLTGTAGRLVVSNGDGVSGNPTFDLATLADGGAGTFLKFTRDAYGRVSATTAVLASDIRTLVDSSYVTKDASSSLANGVVISYNAGTTTFGSTDLVPKSFVESLFQGLNENLTKKESRFLIDTNVSVSAPGAGPFDGVTPVVGNRTFLLNQSAGAENGPWVYNGAAVPLTRPDDFNISAEARPGSTVFISEGTTYGNARFALTTDDPIVLGTTVLTWAQISGLGEVTAGSGLTKTGNTLNIGTASSARIVVNANDIDLATTAVTPGVYTKLTVDAYGRATLGATATPADVGAQPSSAELTGLAALASNGIVARNGSGTYVSRSIVAPAAGITVTDGNGVGGNPTLVLANDLAALEALSTSGFAARTGSDTWTIRSITGTATRIVVSNGDGVSGAPTIDLATTGVGAGTYNSVTVDTYGRVTAASNVASSAENNRKVQVNAHGSTIVIGQAVYSDAAGVKLARANSNVTRRVTGLVLDASISNAASGNIASSGIITATTGQWDAVTGQTGGLTPNTTYYLSAATDGRITPTSPSTTGEWSQQVGYALDSTQLRIEISRSVKI